MAAVSIATARRKESWFLPSDGNVAIYDVAGRAIWATGTVASRLHAPASAPFAFALSPGGR